MILVCGGLADRVAELVCSRLESLTLPYRFVDLGTYPQGFHVNWRWEGSGPVGYVGTGDWRLDLTKIRSVYARFLGPEGRMAFPALDPSHTLSMLHEHDTGLLALFEALPCPVVNRIAGGYSNNSKVYQALSVRQSGLLTPETLVTSDPQEARRFYEECGGQVIYKSLSGIRSIVRRVGPEHLARLNLLVHGPAQFQAYIPGDNIRVHTVGDRYFATRIRSSAVDYRYASKEGAETSMEPAVLPAAIADSCFRIARHHGLLVAGIDLEETPDGQYYCFEVNPSPGFLYYEQYTGQPISAAIAELLHRGDGTAGAEWQS